MGTSDVIRPLVLALIAVAGVPIAAVAQTAVAAPPLAVSELEKVRGGFDLPGGVSVSLGVVTETRINGQDVLRTVFNVQSGQPAITVLARAAGTNDGLTSIGPVVGGTGVATADGIVTLVAMPNGVRVELAGDRLDVSHLVGQSFGSVVANSANDRSIDVATTVNISLGGVSRDMIGGSSARIDTLALDATARLSH